MLFQSDEELPDEESEELLPLSNEEPLSKLDEAEELLSSQLPLAPEPSVCPPPKPPNELLSLFSCCAPESVMDGACIVELK